MFGNVGKGVPFVDDGNVQHRGYGLNAMLLGGIGGDAMIGDDGRDLLFGGYGDDLPTGGPRDRLDDCDGGDTPLDDADDGLSFGGDDNGTLRGVGGSGLLFVGDVGDRLRGGDGADAFIFAAVDNEVGLDADGKIRLSARTSRDSTNLSPSIVSMLSEAMSFPRSTAIRWRGQRTRASTSTAQECSSSSRDLEHRSKQVFLHPPCRKWERRVDPRITFEDILPRLGYGKLPVVHRKSAIKGLGAPVPSMPAGKFAATRRTSKMRRLCREPSTPSAMAKKNDVGGVRNDTRVRPENRPRTGSSAGPEEVGRRTRISPEEAKSTPMHEALPGNLGKVGKDTTRRT